MRALPPLFIERDVRFVPLLLLLLSLLSRTVHFVFSCLLSCHGTAPASPRPPSLRLGF